MKIIMPIVKSFNKKFDNSLSRTIVSSFNKKEKLLFDAILNDEVKTNKQAATLLYDGNPSNIAFAKLKSGMTDKLIDVIVNFNFLSKRDSKRKRVIVCHRNYYAVRILLILTMRSIAIPLALKLIKKSKKENLTFIIMDMYKILSLHYLNHERDEKKGIMYHQLFENEVVKYKDEGLAQLYYGIVMMKTKKKHNVMELSIEADSYVKAIRPLISTGTIRLNLYYYSMSYVSKAIIGDYSSVLENAKEAIQYFQEHDKLNTNTIQHFLSVKVEALLELGKLKEASETLENVDFDPNTFSWFAIQQMKTRLYFALKRYDEAHEVIEHVFSNSNLRISDKNLKETWWLYRYYSELLRMLKNDHKINSRRIKNNLTRFRTHKKGSNVLLRIGDILYSMHNKGIESIYDIQDSIQHYIKEHLSGESNVRDAIFMNLLKTIPNKSLNPTKYNKDVNKFLDRLKSNPNQIKSNKSSTEIIPYENLWEIIEEYLNSERSSVFVL